MAVVWFAPFTPLAHRHPWFVAVAFAVLLILAYRLSRRFSVDLSLVVGQTERHEVRFRWNQWTGRVQISVDGVSRVHTIQWLDVSRTRSYDLSVGDVERHEVSFRKRRHLFASPFREQTTEVLVDGVSAATS